LTFFLRLGKGRATAHKTKAVYHPVCFVLLSASEMRKDRPLKRLVSNRVSLVFNVQGPCWSFGSFTRSFVKLFVLQFEDGFERHLAGEYNAYKLYKKTMAA
jgi:hypothetical protein